MSLKICTELVFTNLRIVNLVYIILSFYISEINYCVVYIQNYLYGDKMSSIAVHHLFVFLTNIGRNV